MEKCFVMLKPGVLNRRLVGEVISRLEKKGLKLIGLKMIRITPELAAKHYAEHLGKDFYKQLVSYITSGPIIAIAWEADDCVTLIRKLVGSTKVQDAQPGTIRGDFCLHTAQNIIHASDSANNGEREIKLFFEQYELFSWADEVSHWY